MPPSEIVGDLLGVLDNPKIDARRRLPTPDQLQPDDLKRFRKEVGITQAELALVLGHSHEDVKQWEQGKERIPGSLSWAIRYVAIALDPRREIL